LGRRFPFSPGLVSTRRTLSSFVFLLPRSGPEVRRVYVTLSIRSFRPFPTTTVQPLCKLRFAQFGRGLPAFGRKQLARFEDQFSTKKIDMRRAAGAHAAQRPVSDRMISCLEFMLSQVPKSGPGAPSVGTTSSGQSTKRGNDAERVPWSAECS